MSKGSYKKSLIISEDKKVLTICNLPARNSFSALLLFLVCVKCTIDLDDAILQVNLIVLSPSKP